MSDHPSNSRMLPQPDTLYCRATSKQSGNRCRNRPIPGGFVCRFHGGSAPQVRAKAQERMRLARDLALERIIEDLAPGVGNMMAPDVRLNIAIKLTEKIELLEGRATERKELAQSQVNDTLANLQGQLEALAARRERQESHLRLVGPDEVGG